MADENEVVLQPEDQEHTPAETGLSPEEQAAFDGMRTGVEAPQPEGAIEGAVEKVEGAPEVKAGAEAHEGDEEDEPETPGAPDATGKKPRRVSFAKYERDLRARDATIAELQKAGTANAEMQARLDERMKIINEALTPKEKQDLAEDDPEPDPENDIFEHNKWLRRQLVKTNEAIKELHGGMQQQTQQTNVERSYVSDVQRFAAQQPKFLEAYNFLMKSRVEELALYYFDKDVTPDADGKVSAQLSQQELNRIQKTIEDEENQLVQNALGQNRSPAQTMFNMARKRGFTIVPPVAAKVNGANGDAKPNGNGAKAPGSLAEAAETDGAPVKAEVQRIQRGVEASTSLSGVGGAPGRTITPQVLADMGQDEFGELMDRLSENEMKRLMGGA